MTDIYILNLNYQVIGIVDNYSSAIFTRRYWECGDFELYIKANNKSLETLQPEYYIQRDTYLYVIESILLSTSQEDGDYLTVGYGFRVHLNDDNKFEFNLYKGKDCSYSQKDNPYKV